MNRLRPSRSADRELVRSDQRRRLVGAIAQAAGIGYRRLAGMFAGPGECLLVCQQMLSARALARAFERARGAADWSRAVCAALASIYSQAAYDPVFARVCFVEVFAVARRGRPIAARCSRVLRRCSPRGRRASARSMCSTRS